MRMWGVNTLILCRNHLLGEHKELHMAVGCLLKNKNIDGFIKKNHLQINLINSRHDEIVKEMLRRGYNHNTPIEQDFSNIPIGKIDLNYNLKDLLNRCPECKKRYTKFKNGKRNFRKNKS